MTLKIHSLANFTTLKYLLTDAKCNSTPWKCNSHQPRAERTQAGERHPGGDVHPERTPPRRGQKPIPFCFLLLLLQSAIHADGLPRVSARFAHLALGWRLIAPAGAHHAECGHKCIASLRADDGAHADETPHGCALLIIAPKMLNVKC